MKQMRKWVSLLLAMVLLMCSTVAFAADVDDGKKCTVRVFTRTTLSSKWVGKVFEFDNAQWVFLAENQVRESVGSAFAVGESGKPVKHFVTNRHVAESDGSFIANKVENGSVTSTMAELVINDPADYTQEIYIIYDNYENKVPAMVLAYSDRADLALLELNQPIDERPAAVIRPFESIGTETVYAAGFPDIADHLKSDEAYNSFYSSVNDITVTSGVINKVLPHSQTQRGEYLHMSVDIFGGNSGGPVLDSKGRVVGVSTSGFGDVNDGANHAVTSNEVVRMLKANDIKYISSDSFNFIPYLIAVGVVGLAVVLMLVLRKKNTPKDENSVNGGTKQPEPQSEDIRKLACEAGALAGKRYRLNSEIHMGTSSGCHIVFPKGTPGVSSKHCTVKFVNGVVTVTDNSSTYGTMIDDKKLAPNQPTIMHRGQRLYLGSKSQSFLLKS